MHFEKHCLSLVLACVLSTSLSWAQSSLTPTTAKSTNTVVQARVLNNAGTMALAKGNFKLAIDNYEAALKLDPNYLLAKQNLAIAHNNVGLSLRADPEKALREFHQSFSLNNTKWATAANIAGMIKLIGLNPDSAADRAKLAQRAMSSGDDAGFNIETDAAKWLTEHPGQKWTDSIAPMPEQDNNFSDYMAALKSQIIPHWHPIKGDEAKRVEVAFKISKQGALSALRIATSSGSSTADKAALSAIRESSPFAKLPYEGPDFVDITFKFDESLLAGGR
jgi:TonB family protein